MPPTEPGLSGNLYLFGNDFRHRDRDGNDWFATTRLRLGYAFDRLLVYGTGGLALTDNIGGKDQGSRATEAAAGISPEFIVRSRTAADVAVGGPAVGGPAVGGPAVGGPAVGGGSEEE